MRKITNSMFVSIIVEDCTFLAARNHVTDVTPHWKISLDNEELEEDNLSLTCIHILTHCLRNH